MVRIFWFFFILEILKIDWIKYLYIELIGSKVMEWIKWFGCWSSDNLNIVSYLYFFIEEYGYYLRLVVGFLDVIKGSFFYLFVKYY